MNRRELFRSALAGACLGLYAALRWPTRPDGVILKRIELVEFSIVPVPVNPAAVAATPALSAGHEIDEDAFGDLHRYCEDEVDP